MFPLVGFATNGIPYQVYLKPTRYHEITGLVEPEFFLISPLPVMSP